MNRVVYVFIDASNLWQAQKAKGKFFDYRKLINALKTQFAATKITAYYYTAYPAEGTRQYDLSSKHKFYTFLSDGLGFIVRKKELKRINVRKQDGVTVLEKGNMDVEMAIDAVDTVKQYDIAVFFTGDSDFLALIEYIQAKGKKVYVFSSRKNISRELIAAADDYYDVLKLSQDVWLQAFRKAKDKK